MSTLSRITAELAGVDTTADTPPDPLVTEGCGGGGAENIVTVTIPHILSLSNGIKS